MDCASCDGRESCSGSALSLLHGGETTLVPEDRDPIIVSVVEVTPSVLDAVALVSVELGETFRNPLV